MTRYTPEERKALGEELDDIRDRLTEVRVDIGSRYGSGDAARSKASMAINKVDHLRTAVEHLAVRGG